MKPEIKKLVDEWVAAENKLSEKLNELEGAGGECNCSDKEVVKFVHEGNLFDEIIVTCLNCGGMVDEQ